MGVYSMDRHQATNVPVVEADLRYHGAVGAQRILAESCQNDLAFFEGVLAGDFKTAVGLKEGTILESEMQAIAEGTVSGFFAKLKEIVKKVWAKIKGLFKNFFIKINALCTGDNKKLVEKYKKEVLNKDLSKMKFKYSKQTGKFIDITAIPSAGAKVAVDSDKTTDKKEEWLGATIGESNGCTVDDYAKEAHSYVFEDEEEFEGLKDAGISISEVMIRLTTSAKALDVVKKEENAIDKKFKDTLSWLEKEEKAIIKELPNKDDADKNKANEAKLENLHKMQNGVNTLNTVYTLACAAIMAAAKFQIAQDRRVFIKAATFNPASVKEDALYVEACCEVSDNEIEDAIATAPTTAEKDAYDAAARDGEVDPIGDVGPQDGSI